MQPIYDPYNLSGQISGLGMTTGKPLYEQNLSMTELVPPSKTNAATPTGFWDKLGG